MIAYGFEDSSGTKLVFEKWGENLWNCKAFHKDEMKSSPVCSSKATWNGRGISHKINLQASVDTRFIFSGSHCHSYMYVSQWW